MGVYLPNMEMPKEYGPHEITITFFVRDDGTASLWGKEVFIPHEPLEVIPIPPHGDLIDRDALEQDAQKRLLICNKYDNHFQKPYEVMRAIALASIIIPASEERET